MSETASTSCWRPVATMSSLPQMALNALQKFRECTGKIDLLLSDIRMPKMSGIQLALKVQLERPGTPVLLMSGYAVESLPSVQCWGFLEKPITPHELRETVQGMLGGL